jgi:hypothetical protein
MRHAPLIRPMAFGAAGLDCFGRDPCLSPADQAHGFWRHRWRR